MPYAFAGRGSIENLDDALQRLDAKRLFVVTGKSSFDCSGARTAVAATLAKRETRFFHDFSPNPTLEEAMAALSLCEVTKADAIVAIGGGSAIDLAKTVSALCGRSHQAEAIATGTAPVDPDALLPIIAIPTTSGTGSEATHFAVIYVRGKKYSIASPFLLPAVSILDPRLTDSLPPYLTACTGFDALCQAIESLWASNANEESRGFARQAIPLIIEHLFAAIKSPTDTSRDALMRGAHLAGKAINISKTTAPHALSYAITSFWGVPHGHAVALSLGAFIAYHGSSEIEIRNESIPMDTFRKTNTEIQHYLGAQDASSAKDSLYRLMARCGLELSPQSIDLAGQANLLAREVNAERLANHPVVLDHSQLVSILQDIPEQVC